MFSCVFIFAGLIVSHRKDENSVKTKPLIKRLLSTVVVCCRLLSDMFGLQVYLLFGKKKDNLIKNLVIVVNL